MTATATRTPALDAPRRPRTRVFQHRPGLDGLRGLAVAGVLAYHLDRELVPGGYLGVSAFFTLSGFLIATLLVQEHESSGRVALVAFWARRARRLLPVALVGIAGAVGLVVLTGDQVAVTQVRGDALSALAYVANWRFVLRDLSYAELFSAESPLQHLWSLAIEEQFYLLLPLLVVALGRGHRLAIRLGTSSLVLIVLSVATNLLVADPDRQYYGTDTRATELLVGVALACAHHIGLTARIVGRTRDVVGALALASLVLLWLTVGTLGAELQPWVLLAHALLTAAVVLAALGGRVADLLSLGPLTALGRISYAAYVYHWPIYLWLDATRTGLDGVALAALRVAVTLGAAVLSAHLLERPIRYGSRTRPRRDLLVAGAAMVTVAGSVTAATWWFAPPPLIDFGSAAEVAADLGTPDDTSTAPPAPSSTRVAVFGDSTAVMLVPGLETWARQHPDELTLVRGFAELGCPLGRGGARLDPGQVIEVPEWCSFSTSWREALVAGQPDVAVVQVGLWDVVDRVIPGSDEVVRLGDPVYDAYLESEINAAADLMSTFVDRVVWILQPAPMASMRLDEDPAPSAIPILNDRLREWLGGRSDVAIVDLAGWLEATGRMSSTELRPDGTHFSTETSVTAAEWLAPAILRAAEQGGVVGAGDVEVVPVEP